jgi:hypothetical protein
MDQRNLKSDDSVVIKYLWGKLFPKMQKAKRTAKCSQWNLISDNNSTPKKEISIRQLIKNTENNTYAGCISINRLRLNSHRLAKSGSLQPRTIKNRYLP